MFAIVHSVVARVFTVSMTGTLLLACANGQGVQGDEKLPAGIVLAEKTAALEAAITRIQKLEKQLAAAESQAQALKEALITANAESVEFGQEYQKLRTKVEALGPELLEKGESGIQSKLISAVRDLGIAREENDRLADQLLNVTEAVMAYLSSDTDEKKAETRGRLEAQMLSSDQLLGFRMDSGERRVQALHLGDSQIVSIKKEWGLVVINSGSAGGVKISTPIEIMRAGRPVANGTIVDVRETISGAIVTSAAAVDEAVRIGDGIRLAVATDLQNQ